MLFIKTLEHHLALTEQTHAFPGHLQCSSITLWFTIREQRLQIQHDVYVVLLKILLALHTMLILLCLKRLAFFLSGNMLNEARKPIKEG